MNIGLLSVSCAWGGSEVHSAELTRTLCRRGHTATLVCLTDRAYLEHRERLGPSFPLAHLPAPKPMRQMGFMNWRRLFRRQPWDACVLIKGDLHSGGGWAIDLAARHRVGAYLVLEQKDVEPMSSRTRRRHFGFIPGLGLWWYREHFRRFLRSAGPRVVVCVSKANARRLVSEHFFPARKVATISNGADIERFRPSSPDRKRWRGRWGIPDQALVLGAIGRLAPIKNYEVAIDAFHTLVERFPERDLRLVLAGEGPLETALRDQAARLLPPGRVVFTPFDHRPWEPLNALDIFLMPSLNEGLPITLAEAMACGCCPIATPVGGIRELITSPDLGFLVPVNDRAAFAEAMVAAVSLSADQRAALGERAREHVVTHFNAATQFAVLAEVIERTALGVRRTRPVPPRLGEVVGP